MTTVRLTPVTCNSSWALIGSMRNVKIKRGFRMVSDPGHAYPIEAYERGLADAESIGGMFETKDSGEREVYDSGMQRDVTEGKTK